ncbi:hypothetical protein QJQ45_010290 [Haematococcus lacustris]|nr:hypothetical protein QJQ45_010290 [Haematococcus lacustris]
MCHCQCRVIVARAAVCLEQLAYLEDRALDDPVYNPVAADNRLVDLRSVLFIVRASLQNAQRVAAMVRGARTRAAAGAGAGTGGAGRGAAAQDFSVFFVPRTTVACERVLEEEVRGGMRGEEGGGQGEGAEATALPPAQGVAGDVVVGELGALEVLALEDDVLSLELDSAFKECVVDGDSTSLFYTARALLRLQAMFGTIPRLQGKGPAALAVRDMAARMRRENPELLAAAAGAVPLISRAVLLDREVDLVTAVMSQITLEGLVDEVTGIRGGAVPWAPRDKKAAEAAGVAQPGTALPSGAPGGGGAGGGSTLLNSTDPFYREFRDLPYHLAISRLQAAAREARREYEALNSKDLSQLRSFVKGLPKLLLLDRLSDVAQPCAERVRQQLFHDRLKHELDAVEGVELEAGLAFVQEMMFRGSELLEVLRLLVLLNETHHGLPRKALDALRPELLAVYGGGHALTLAALEKAGFLRPAAPGKPPFAVVRKALRLVPPEGEGGAQSAGGGQQQAGSEAQPNDISHIYKGYAPLSIRLVEQAVLQGGWGPVAEALAVLPGPAFDVVQVSEGGSLAWLQEVDSEGRPVERAAQPSGPAPGTPTPPPPTAASSSRGQAAPSRAAGAGRGGGDASGSQPDSPRGAGLGRQEAREGAAGVSQGGGEVVLVVFLGGVTFSEISALRWLSARGPHRFLVLTTKVVNGCSLLAGFVDPAVARAGAAVGLQTDAGT